VKQHHRPRSALSRRNQTLGIMNGMLVNLGNAFVDPFTVLPVFITTLGGSSVLVGFVTAAFTAFWFLPQLWVAGMAQTRRRVLSIYAGSSIFRFIGFVGAGASIFWIDPSHRNAIMAFVIGGLALNAFAAGVAGVPFLEITSKTVPVNQRGAFFGGRRVLGGILGVGAGILIAVVLGGDPGAIWARTRLYLWVKSLALDLGLAGRAFPYDYGVLIIIGGVISAAGVLAYLFVEEPDAKHVSKPVPLRRLLADGFAMLRSLPDYRSFLWMRIFYQLTAMCFPFYATFAYTRLGFTQATVGLFVSIWLGAGVFSNLMWGPMLDRSGHRNVFLWTAVISVLPPLVILLLPVLHRGSDVNREMGAFIMVAITFLMNGFVRAGRFIANHTYLLEVAPRERRPLYVGFMNTMTFPFMLSPILGGAIVGLFGYRTLFVIGLLSAVANWVVSARLVEPRRTVHVTDQDLIPA
jgi:MFS family permease